MVARLLFLLIFIVGAVAGIGYPLIAAHVSGYEIGAWKAYSPATGFIPIAVNIAPADAPLFPHVEIATNGPLLAGDRTAYLTLTVTADGTQERAQTSTSTGSRQPSPARRQAARSIASTFRLSPPCAARAMNSGSAKAPPVSTACAA